jgi:hypothetical protein
MATITHGAQLGTNAGSSTEHASRALGFLYVYTIVGAGLTGLWMIAAPASFAIAAGMPSQDVRGGAAVEVLQVVVEGALVELVERVAVDDLEQLADELGVGLQRLSGAPWPPRWTSPRQSRRRGRPRARPWPTPKWRATSAASRSPTAPRW